MSHLSPSRRSRCCARPAALALVAFTTLSAAAGPAHAKPLGRCDGPCPEPPPSTPSCSNNLSPRQPYKTAHADIIALNGVLSCSSEPFDRVYIYLQRQRAYGWQTMTKRDIPGTILAPFNRWTWRNSVPYACHDTGTHTFRVRIVGYERGRQVMDRIGPSYETECPAAPSLHPTLKRCDNSDWMTRAGGIGSGADFVVSLQPTFRARVFGRGRNIVGKRFVEYIWRDLNRCVQFPDDLLASQRESLNKQLVCHVEYAVARPVGGNTWDLEAKRSNVPWPAVINPTHTCNWD